jgi:hypothetical protein
MRVLWRIAHKHVMARLCANNATSAPSHAARILRYAYGGSIAQRRQRQSATYNWRRAWQARITRNALL